METLKKIHLLLAFTLVLSSVSLFGQDDIVNAFKDSYTLEQKGDFTKAIDKMKSVYQNDSYEINLRLGWLFYLAGNLTESEKHYNTAISLKPLSIEARWGLAYPLSAAAKWDDLIAVYNKILEIDPQNTITNYRLGLIYYNRQNYEKADLYLEKVINLHPFDYDSMLLLAWNKLALQKFREAKVLFNKVLMFSPDDASALEGLKLIK